MPVLKIGKIQAALPIIQGGMSVGISLSGLAAAVANEGGIGVIGSAGIGMKEPDYQNNFREANRRALRKEIRRARRLTDGIIGVNIMLALTDYDDLLLVAMEEEVELVFLGAGIPLMKPDTIALDRLQRYKTSVIPIVSSARAARLIFRYWANRYDHVPDAIVVEGPAAGGHLGFKRDQIEDPDFSLESLLQEIVPVVRAFEERFKKQIPVIAAGGIYNGADIHRILQMDVQGVQMATRFVATDECDASVKFKQAYLDCRQEDIIIIDSPVGMPGRALRNRFLEDVDAGIKKPFNCPWKCLHTCDFRQAPYCIALALNNAQHGRLDDGFAFMGANAWRVDRIMPVKELVESLRAEYAAAVTQSSQPPPR
ncbi:MAG: nitronate monooxygenase [Candidatus Delongbacteria bacterium]|nr:nitronate monooxygenase [bacterium]MBL7033287.1 nitronate monooxygenase [Candidatus Delongbacteria bacterium]